METTGKLPLEFKQKWVAALRSEKYKQGRNQLFNKKNQSYCCLGVACVVQGANKEDFFGDYDIEIGSICTYNLRSLTPELLWSSEENPISERLINMNDIEGESFNEIADWIEENL